MTRKKNEEKSVGVVVFVLSHPEISNFEFCLLVCDIVRFDLRVFLGVLACFCVLCGKLLGCAKENVLERLKMRFVFLA